MPVVAKKALIGHCGSASHAQTTRLLVSIFAILCNSKIILHTKEVKNRKILTFVVQLNFILL